MELKEEWKQICNDYLQEFADKHGYDISYELENGYVWVADNPGTIACIGDIYVNMEVIRYDIDNDIPENYFEEWYWKYLDVYENDQTYMNYENFCKGCPDPDEQKRVIEMLKKRVTDAKKALETAMQDLIDEQKKFANK